VTAVVEPPTVESTVHKDLGRIRSALLEAELAGRPADRYLAAYLAALRTAALVLAVRARPAQTAGRPRNAWQVLAEVAPELGEWAGFFASIEGKREAVRAGATTIVSARQADDLVRDAEAFLAVVERAIGRRSAGAADRTWAAGAGVNRS
jgi:hypothetical protein